MAGSTPRSYSTDPTLYLYTSLTAGSSHIITATARLETILKVNKVDYQALDVATDEQARMLWGRRAGKRQLPGLVKQGLVLGNVNEIEEWNEYGEVKQRLADDSAPASTGITRPSTTDTSRVQNQSQPPASEPSEEQPSPTTKTALSTPLTEALRKVGQEAANRAKANEKEPTRDVRSPVPSAATSRTNKSSQEVGVTSMSAEIGKAEGLKDQASAMESRRTGNQSDTAVTELKAIAAKYQVSDVADVSDKKIEETEKNAAIPEQNKSKEKGRLEDEDDENKDQECYRDHDEDYGQEERPKSHGLKVTFAKGNYRQVASDSGQAEQVGSTSEDTTQDQPAAKSTLVGISIGD